MPLLARASCISFYLTELLIIFCLPEMLRNSFPQVSAQVTWNVHERVETLRSNHGLSECIYISRRGLTQPSLLIRWQTKPQHDAQLIEQRLNLIW